MITEEMMANINLVYLRQNFIVLYDEGFIETSESGMFKKFMEWMIHENAEHENYSNHLPFSVKFYLKAYELIPGKNIYLISCPNPRHKDALISVDRFGFKENISSSFCALENIRRMYTLDNILSGSDIKLE